MRLRLLETSVAVARTRNSTRSAEELNLTQSSVSDRIQSLEAELRSELFTRSKSGLDLTPAGEMLTSYAEDILALSAEARGAVVGASRRETGSLTIGAIET